MTTINSHFRVAPLTAEDVLATWAGLRPLIDQPGKSAKEMSRRDEIWRDGSMITVAGGKLTGFRHMARDAMAAVSDVLDRPLDMPRPLAPLPGGDIVDLAALVAAVGARYQLEDRVAARLVRCYGSEVYDVLGDGPSPIAPSVFAEEVLWAVEVDGARSLEDVVYRRLRAAWFLPEELDGLLERSAGLLADRLGWDATRLQRELQGVRGRLADELAFRTVN